MYTNYAHDTVELDPIRAKEEDLIVSMVLRLEVPIAEIGEFNDSSEALIALYLGFFSAEYSPMEFANKLWGAYEWCGQSGVRRCLEKMMATAKVNALNRISDPTMTPEPYMDLLRTFAECFSLEWFFSTCVDSGVYYHNAARYLCIADTMANARATYEGVPAEDQENMRAWQACAASRNLALLLNSLLPRDDLSSYSALDTIINEAYTHVYCMC